MRKPRTPSLAGVVGAALLGLAGMNLGGCSRSAPAAATAGAAPPTTAAQAVPEKRVQFKFATQTLSVPEGFTVELVAGPPMVNRPISVAFDAQGRLYATDSSGLSDRAPVQFEQKPHRVVRLEDSDGDGRYDQSVVFADKMMFPQGALFYEGSLYVAAPPQIWKLTDTNGDGVADERVAWYDGKTLTGCANDVHGPYLGPDGWFYWTKGAFAEQKHTLGNGKEFVTRAAHIFRARPDGSGMEPVLTGGMDNPVGVTFSPTGDRILNGTFFQIGVAGKRDGLIHAVYGGVYGKENAATTGHPRTGDLMPIMTHMGAAAPCGSTAYRSGGFGADYRDNLFVCYFNLRKISRHQLVPEGATYRTIDSDFVTSDSQDFRPTDVLEDADGSLLVVDTGGWYKICCPTSQLAKPDVLGAIYRVRKTGARKLDDPRGSRIPWASTPVAELTRLLGDERLFVQDRAAYQLGKLGVAAVPALADALSKSATPAARRNVLQTLARIDAVAARAAVRPALTDPDSSVALTALNVVSLWRDAGAIEPLLKLLASGTPAAVRLAAEALGRIGDPRALEPLLAAARRLPNGATTALGAPEAPAERMLEHSIIYALLELGRRDELLAHLTTNESPRAARAALVALDQMGGGGLKAEQVVMFLQSPVPMLKHTAGWLVGFHPEWGAALSSFFRTQLTAQSRSEAERNELQAQLAQLAKASAIQELLAAVVGDPTAGGEAQLTALRAMAGSSLKETPAGWFPALAGALGRDDAAVVKEAVLTARVLPPAKAVPAPFASALARIGRDRQAAEDVRLDALSVAPASIGVVDAELFAFLCEHLAPKQPMVTRSAAATVLAKAPLSASQQLDLADQMKGIGPLEAPKLLPAFERGAREDLGLKLVAALRQSPGLPGIRVNALKPVFAKYSPAVQQRADELCTLINADAAKQNARVDELLTSCKGGDIRRGQEVFNGPKAACSLCHVLGYRGGRLGPDLTNIGKIRNERELIEAIVFPSGTFVRGYEPFVVTRKSGESVTGIMRKDAPDEVVLATGPETEQRIARSDVAEIQPGAVSPMPPGYEVMLTPQELADLVAFLKSRS